MSCIFFCFVKKPRAQYPVPPMVSGHSSLGRASTVQLSSHQASTGRSSSLVAQNIQVRNPVFAGPTTASSMRGSVGELSCSNSTLPRINSSIPGPGQLSASSSSGLSCNVDISGARSAFNLRIAQTVPLPQSTNSSQTTLQRAQATPLPYTTGTFKSDSLRERAAVRKATTSPFASTGASSSAPEMNPRIAFGRPRNCLSAGREVGRISRIA